MKTTIITGVVTMFIGAAGAWFLAPRRVEVKEVEKWRVITVRDTTRTRETTRPDGTRVVERTETRVNTREAGTSTTTTTPHPRWSASLLGGLTLTGDKAIGASVSYRLVGPFTVGGWALTAGPVTAGGVSVGVTF